MNIAELTATDPDKSKIGIWLNTADSQIAEISTAAGFDWVCVDLQHDPPVGTRSCGPTRAMAYDAQYLAHANDRVSCVIMIETALGFANVNEIAALPGVDALFVGPAALISAVYQQIPRSTQLPYNRQNKPASAD